MHKHEHASRVAIDTSIIIYQALKSITTKRNLPLVSRNGEIASHLYLLLYRCISYFEIGIHPLFILEYTKSSITKPIASVRHTTMSPSTVKSADELLMCLGAHIIRAQGEGDAVGSNLVRTGKADIFATTDIDDAFFFGCPVCSNSNLHADTILNNIITLKMWLSRFGFKTLTQYRDFFILMGNDYNKKMLPNGMGKKKAIELLIKYGRIENIPNIKIDFEVLNIIRNIGKNSKQVQYNEIKQSQPDFDKLANFLHRYDFDTNKITNCIQRLKKIANQRK